MPTTDAISVPLPPPTLPPLPPEVRAPIPSEEQASGHSGGESAFPPAVISQLTARGLSASRDVIVAGRDVNITNYPPIAAGDLDSFDALNQEPYKVRQFGSGYGSSSGGGHAQSRRELARKRPAMMLGGHAAVTPFVGRQAELASLEAWYGGPDRVSVLLVHGAVGQGKTRLTRQFASLIADRRDQPVVRETISLTEVPIQPSAGQDEPADTGVRPAGILLLVDEADLWTSRKLRKLFHDTAALRCDRVRLLLTARSPAEWWPVLHNGLNLPEVTWHDLPLGPLNPPSMRDLASAAARSHAAVLGWAEPPPLTGEIWAQLAESPPLSVELVVLAGIHAANDGQLAPTNPHAAAERFLQKELRYWEHLHGSHDPHPGNAASRIRLVPQVMRRAVYIATLAGPLGEATARRIVGLACLGGAPDPQQLIEDHARCYPADDNQYLAPLPTCLAEEFLGLLVPGSTRPTGPINQDKWALNAPFRILDLLDPQAREDEKLTRTATAKAGFAPRLPTPDYSEHITFGPQQTPLVMRLVRAASKWPHLAEQQLYPLAELYPQVVTSVEGVWPELLKIRTQPSDKVLAALSQAIVRSMPQHSPEWRMAMNALRQLADRKAGTASSAAV